MKEKQKRWTALEVLEFMREHTVSSFRNEIDAAIKEVKAKDKKYKALLRARRP